MTTDVAQALKTLTAGAIADGETAEQYAFRKTLASILLAAAHNREASYDHVAADAASAANDSERAELTAAGKETAYCIVDYAKFYGLDLYQSADKACKDAGFPLLTFPVYLLIDGFWNDVSDWATGKHFEEVPVCSTSPDDVSIANDPLTATAYNEEMGAKEQMQSDDPTKMVLQGNLNIPNAAAGDDDWE